MHEWMDGGMDEVEASRHSAPHISPSSPPELPALVLWPCPPPGCVPVRTAEALKDKVKFAASLEGVGQFHNEGVLHRLQNVPLSPRVCRVLGVAHNFGLQRQGWVRRWVPRTPSAPAVMTLPDQPLSPRYISPQSTAISNHAFQGLVYPSSMAI